MPSRDPSYHPPPGIYDVDGFRKLPSGQTRLDGFRKDMGGQLGRQPPRKRQPQILGSVARIIGEIERR
jgi:hypothetical protein